MRFKYLAVAAVLGLSSASVPAIANSTETVLTQKTFVDVSKKVLPSVVSIDVSLPMSQRIRNNYGVDSPDELFRKFWLERQDEENDNRLGLDDLEDYSPDEFGFRGSGSGVVVHIEDEWAYVLTNLHVIETNPNPLLSEIDPKTRFNITLDACYDESCREIPADQVEFVGSDELTDTAILRFRVPEAVEIQSVEFADSDQVEIGEWVLALGNPLELNNSVSQGIISAKNRTLGVGNRIESLLQTTAVINPGNSGGPLVNLDGDIVGINNAIMTQTGRWAGIGFAVPGNNARYAAEQIINGGSVSRGYLGVSMVDVDDIRSSVYDRGLQTGVSVEDVRPGTPAHEAGLRKGDVILSVEGKKIHSSQGLLIAIAGRMAGESIDLTVQRFDGSDEPETVEMAIELARRPTEEELLSEQRESRVSEAVERATNRLGIEIEPADEGTFAGMRVTAVEPRSNAARAGLREGDLIIQMNGISVETAVEMGEAMMNVDENIGHVTVIRRNGSNQTLTIDAPTR